MRKIILMGFLFLLSYGGSYSQGFEIKGQVAGTMDGAKVRLYDQESQGQQINDSAVVRAEKFILRHTGSLEWPLFCHLEINNTPGEPDRMKQDVKFYTCWVENGVMQLSCPFGKMQGYRDRENRMGNVEFTGSATQDLYMQYAQEVRTGRKTLKEVSMDFIKAHPASVLSLTLANSVLSVNRCSLTVAEVDALVGCLEPPLTEMPLMEKVREYAASARCLAKGTKYPDIELTTLDGQRVKLSGYVRPGQYNMLEFWASFCGPCRAEIPHLKKLRQQYPDDELHLVSISTDTKEVAWKKAAQEEGMDWVQLNDPLGNNGPVVNEYRIYGIPFCLVLDPEGRIVFGGNIRGSLLDARLKEVLGH